MWTGDHTKNRTWYEQLVDACKSTSGVTCGIYGGYNGWLDIFGSTTYEYGSELPIWYAHYNSIADFSDFKAFGGWSSPWGKQFKGDTSVCGFNVDVNYIP